MCNVLSKSPNVSHSKNSHLKAYFWEKCQTVPLTAETSQHGFRVLVQYRAAVSLWYHRGGLKSTIPGIMAHLGTFLPHHAAAKPNHRLTHWHAHSWLTLSLSVTHTFYITVTCSYMTFHWALQGHSANLSLQHGKLLWKHESVSKSMSPLYIPAAVNTVAPLCDSNLTLYCTARSWCLFLLLLLLYMLRLQPW